MSTGTPETTNPYKARREAVARAITRWQEQDGDGPQDAREDGPLGEAADLEDCLNDEGLILLPRSTGHGKWMVLVDGRPARQIGSDRPAGPVDAEEAADLFLTVTGLDDYNKHHVEIRPATDAELVASVWDHITGGAA